MRAVGKQTYTFWLNWLGALVDRIQSLGIAALQARWRWPLRPLTRAGTVELRSPGCEIDTFRNEAAIPGGIKDIAQNDICEFESSHPRQPRLDPPPSSRDLTYQ